jgi:hypothetical protein
LAGGDHTALVMITHDGVDRHEVEAVLRRRWPDVVVKAMSPDAAANLGRRRRGVEPLRIVVMPQQDQQTITSSIIEAMPVVV